MIPPLSPSWAGRSSSTTSVSATPPAAAEKDKTIVGEGACAKCILKETKECQHTITVEEGGKPVVYYVTQNHAAKEFANQLCAEKKKVKATGIAKTVGDKHVLTPTKIELAKE